MPESLLEFFSSVVRPRSRKLAGGQAVFRPGDPVAHIYGVHRGGIRMVRYNDHGDEILIYRAAAGETFAEAALFGDVFHCHALAETDSTILCFDRAAILAAVSADPGVLESYCALLSRQVRELRSMLEIRSTRSAPERVLHYLRLHAGREGRCRVAVTFKELASQLGLSHETMYRALKRLEDEGRISRQGREIRLL